MPAGEGRIRDYDANLCLGTVPVENTNQEIPDDCSSTQANDYHRQLPPKPFVEEVEAQNNCKYLNKFFAYKKTKDQEFNNSGRLLHCFIMEFFW